MARAVARRGHTVSIYTTNQDGPIELDVPTDRPVFDGGVEIRYFPIQQPRFWGFSRPLARALRLCIPRMDVVHIHSLYLYHGAVAAHYARKHGVPYLIRCHGTLDPFLYRRHRLRKSVMEALFENRNLMGAAALHFTTEEEARLAAPYTRGAPGMIVPNGVEMDEYRDLPSREELQSRFPELAGKKIILFLGRINFKKGLDILARAFADVARAHDDARLMIAGPDNEGLGEKVRRWLADEGVTERVTFTGMLLGEEKLAALSGADLFVLPSYTENFGIAVVEAMACGLPVVISNRVNIWREVVDYGAGRVCPCRPEEFASTMIELLGDHESAARMGENGRKLVTERFTWSSVGEALENVYASLVHGRQDAVPRVCGSSTQLGTASSGRE